MPDSLSTPVACRKDLTTCTNIKHAVRGSATSGMNAFPTIAASDRYTQQPDGDEEIARTYPVLVKSVSYPTARHMVITIIRVKTVIIMVARPSDKDVFNFGVGSALV